MHHTFDIGGKPHAILLSHSPEGYRLALAEGGSAAVSLAQTRGGEGRLTVDGSSEPIAYVVEGDTRGNDWFMRCTCIGAITGHLSQSGLDAGYGVGEGLS